MRGTTPRLLVLVALGAGVVSFGVFRAWFGLEGTLPQVPVSAPAVLAFVALVFVVAAAILTPRLHATTSKVERRAGDPKPLHPLAAARVAVMSVAAGLVGAVVAGGYAGFAVVVLTDLDSDFRRQQLLLSLLSIAAAVVLVVAAHLLERACRLPDSRDDDQAGLGPNGVA
jgi:hypothetical protein